MYTQLGFALQDFEAQSIVPDGPKQAGAVKFGQRLHGDWMNDGRFLFPMTQPDGKTAACIASADLVAPIIEETVTTDGE